MRPLVLGLLLVAGCDNYRAWDYEHHFENRDAGLSRNWQEECAQGAQAKITMCRGDCVLHPGSEDVCRDFCKQLYDERISDCKRGRQ